MIKAKKSLGQNFLIDETVIDKIVETTSINNKNVIEIGPGTGNLTKAILKKNPKKFFVVEKDNNLSMLLRENFKDQIIIINEDILKFNEKDLIKEKLIVFGNLPYNISTEILCKWIVNLKNRDFWFDELILMFQKEVAERIIAKFNTSNYGRLTILANWKLNVKKILVTISKFFGSLISKKSSLGVKCKRVLSILGLGEKLPGYISQIFFTLSFQLAKIVKRP